MSFPFNDSNNHDSQDDIENEHSNPFSQNNSIQSFDDNINNENIEFFNNHQEIFERVEREEEEELSINDSSTYSIPHFIIFCPNEHEKKRRGRKSSFNAKYSKKVMHLSSSEDNILSKIQIHFLNFVIFFLNDCIFNYYKNKKIKFIKFAHAIKSKVSSEYLNNMKNSTIYDMLTKLDISSKYKQYPKNINKNIVVILNRISWFKKLFGLKFLDLFYYYYNNTEQLKKVFLFNKEIALSNSTKSYYFLLEKNKKLKQDIIQITKYNYLFNHLEITESDKQTEEKSEDDGLN